MNWTRVLLGGLAAGIVTNVADFIMHGMILSPTYTRYPEVFTQTPANPLWFTVISIAIGLTVALLFAMSRNSWAAGAKGGATFGAFVGLVGFFPPFYNSIVLEGFPYFLSWCWGGITVIDGVLAGAVLGLVIRRA